MVIAKKSKSTADRCLVDASIYIFRAYFSLPPNWQSEDGDDTEAVYGFTNFLLDLLLCGPTHVGVCFDESLETGFRHRLYPGYKASRALPDEALAYQLKACQTISTALGLASFASQEYEADDLIGSLLQGLQADTAAVAILTRDKDLGQLLIRPQDYLWDYAADARVYREDIFAKFGVWPEQMVDYLALVGDTSDDIPGVPGVGKKTAALLLADGGQLSPIMAEPDRIAHLNVRGAATLAGKLGEYAQQIHLAKKLATIACDVPTLATPPSLVPAAIDEAEVAVQFKRLGLGGLQKKLQRLVRQRAEDGH